MSLVFWEEVHPRVCGGSANSRRSRNGIRGTSPRVRGKLFHQSAANSKKGYIPACAGEARPGPGAPSSDPVHPRVCGGSHRSAMIDSSESGTSPRVRGKPRKTPRRGSGWRYIPACAGEAPSRCNPNRERAVHPRVCGGSTAVVNAAKIAWGTSPRVRGKLRGPHRHGAGAGYIPACAGEASGRQPGTRPTRVHPRVCGGSAEPDLLGYREPGTSPRVRGKRQGSRNEDDGQRYIPACAGEARLSSATTTATKVHPRVCGGSRRRYVTTHSLEGTSPRVRGKLPESTEAADAHRYIPACAGEAFITREIR